MAVQITPWDSAQHLKTDEDIQFYLEACLEEAGEEPALLTHALRVIARAKEIHPDTTPISQELQEQLSSDHELTFSSMVKALKSIGFKLSIQPTS
ncbi:MAG: transcriptional regulator [Cyanothece sp. SIO2G6]|nr:transcriptional regulator [Cyanothece sp. SIO2G6]